MSSLITPKKAAENFTLAEENYLKGKKKAGTTLLRWKPDWEGAARWYREACKYYKLSGPGHARHTVAALRESAHAHQEIQSWHTAAADLEAAGTITLNDEEVKDSAVASALFTEAAMLYRTHGSSHDKAAATLVKAAEAIGDIDVVQGVELMKQACSIFEEEGRAMFHDATFKKAICFCINRQKFGSARALLHRQIAIAQQHMNPFEADIYRCCLAIVVLRFHTEDYEKAAEELQAFESLERFASSEECRVANEMVMSWEDGDAEAFNACVKKQVFKFLLNPVAVIARKLSMPDDVARTPAGTKPASSSNASASSSSSSAPPKKSKKKVVEEEEEIDLR